MSKHSHFTLVFKVEDESQFKEFLNGPMKSLSSQEPFHGGTVVAAGWDDSMSRADALVELCEENGIDVPNELR